MVMEFVHNAGDFLLRHGAVAGDGEVKDAEANEADGGEAEHPGAEGLHENFVQSRGLPSDGPGVDFVTRFPDDVTEHAKN